LEQCATDGKEQVRLTPHTTIQLAEWRCLAPDLDSLDVIGVVGWANAAMEVA